MKIFENIGKTFASPKALNVFGALFILLGIGLAVYNFQSRSSSSPLESAAIGFVILIIGSILIGASRQLNEGHKHLDNEKVALTTVRGLLFRIELTPKTRADYIQVLKTLENLPHSSAAFRRQNTLATHQAKNALTPIDRVALIETESARQQAGTDGPRFWAGALTFIGLLGTLAGLTLAVFHLISVINSGAATDITPAMASTFSGMGGAFLATGAGVTSSLLLSYSVSQHEHEVESFRLEFEEFSHLSLEPFMRRAVAGEMVETVDELEPLRALLERLEAVTVQSTQSGANTRDAFGLLLTATREVTAGLNGASTNFEAGISQLNNAFSHTLQPLGEQIVALGKVVEDQKRVQEAFRLQVAQDQLLLREELKSALDEIKITTNLARQAFTDLATTNAGMQQGFTDNASLLQSTLRATHEGLSELKTTLQGDSGTLTTTLQTQIERLETSLKNGISGIRNDNATTLGTATRVLADSLGEVKTAIAQGNGQQSTLLENLSKTSEHLRTYAEEVDSALRDQAARLNAEPLIEFEGKHYEASVQASQELGQTITKLGQEIRTLSSATSTVTKGAGTGTEEIQRHFSGLTTSVSQGLSDMQTTVTGVNNQVRQIETQIENLKNPWMLSISVLCVSSVVVGGVCALLLILHR